MKKIFAALLTLTIAMAALPNQATAQLYYNGKNVSFKFPRGVDSSRNYTFPTFKYRDLAYDDTLAISVTDLETYVNCDTMTDNAYAIITKSDYVYPGAKLLLKLASSRTDSLRTVYVKQGTTVIDTILVGRTAYRNYFYNGVTFIKANNAGQPEYVAAVTQSSSITTAVTLNADAGIITTVSSTIAADDSSASFTFNNSFIKSTSPILLTAGTAGNGCPRVQITSQTDGSCVLKLSNNHRLAALNNTVKIHFWIPKQ